MHTNESILPTSRKIKFIAVGIPCMLAMYVLSIGPMAKMEDVGLIGERTGKVFQVFYTPLALLGAMPETEEIFNWYIFHVWNCDSMGDNAV